MLTRIEVTNLRGQTIDLGIEEDDLNPYQVQSIEGLEPVKATIASSDSVGADGAFFQSAKREVRNIVIKLDLDPTFLDDSYTSLRQGLYPFFTPTNQVKFRFFHESGLYLDIMGVVESFGSPLFEKEPTVDISVICHNPDFEDPRIIQIDGMTVEDDETMDLIYPGSVASGTVVTLNINRPATDLTIYNVDGGGNITQLDFSGELEDGDTLVISSRKGAKGITLTRAGVSSSYLYGRSPQSKWVELNNGENNFRIYAPGDPIPYVLEYVVRYGGL